VKRPLFVCGAGAVTPAGLNAAQTCAAIRASLSAFEEMVLAEPFGATQIVARIPAHWRLRRTEGEWLVNMAARALSEALETGAHQPEATIVLLTPPESFREHPAYADIAPGRLLAAVLAAIGRRFHPASRAVDGGAAASVGVLERGLELLDGEGATQLLVGGVDSLVNSGDLGRLGRAGRLKGDDNAQGLVPGEAAAFVRLRTEVETGAPFAAAIWGVGAAREADSVLSERYSQGGALLAAFRGAVAGQGPREPDIGFVVSNGNGERYSGWEAMIARPRFFRTRREILPTAYPAMTCGDVGAAGGALALIVAADSLTRGYAPAPIALCELASEGGLRAAATIGEVGRQGPVGTG
jgi:3-oxoacyl-[acyl-carrier-protein] synthase-1